MLQVRTLVELNAVWDLAVGQISFWWDNWLGNGPLAWYFPHLAGVEAVAMYWLDDDWDFGTLRTMLPNDILKRMDS